MRVKRGKRGAKVGENEPKNGLIQYHPVAFCDGSEYRWKKLLKVFNGGSVTATKCL